MRSLGRSMMLFAATGVPFGALMGLLSWSLRTGIITGLLFGFFMALALGTYDAISQRGNTGSRGVRQRGEASFPGSEPEARKRVRRALRRLGAKVEKHGDDGPLMATTGMNVKSFGTTVQVTFEQQGAETLVRVSGRPQVRTTLVDYGESRRVVRFVLDAVRLPA